MSGDKKLLIRIIIRIAFFPLFMGLLVLLPAGTWAFWQVYAYVLALMFPLISAMIYFYLKDPSFLERRMRTKEKETAQKVFVALSAVSIAGAFVIPGLDYRFGWSRVPWWAVIAGDLIVVLSYLFIFYVFRTNSWASRVIEVADDQTVISTGPYAVVRHPMYSGMFLLYVATPVALASWWGIISSLLLLPLLVMRILNEEKLLIKELEGYEEYRSEVKYRLIPLIW